MRSTYRVTVVVEVKAYGVADAVDEADRLLQGDEARFVVTGASQVRRAPVVGLDRR
jgi:hypothetical protein